MYTNNLVIDYKNKVKIPQNLTNLFIILKNPDLRDSIEIRIRPYEEIDIVNLYVILKSYSLNLIYVPSNFLIMIKNPDEDYYIVYNKSVEELKSISFYGFYTWFYEQLHQDWKYIKEGGEYSFLFTYPLKLFDMSLLEFLKPRYPWNSELLQTFAQIKKTEEYYIKTIERQKKEIEDLRKIIDEFKKNRN